MWENAVILPDTENLAGARAREYEPALQWLNDAGMVRQVFRVGSPGLPLMAYTAGTPKWSSSCRARPPYILSR